MTVKSTAAPRAQANSFTIPYITATTAAVLLAAASCLTNVSAAVAKHDAITGQLIAGSIALSVALMVAVALPAALSAFKSRQYVASTIAALVFVLTASYSITSALGVLGAPRLTATASANHDSGERSRLMAERKRALDTLATLAPARSSSELNSQIAAKLGRLGSQGACRKQETASVVKACAEIAALQTEAARFDRIAALSGTVARIDSDLTRLGKPSLGNADAAALVAIATAFGLSFDGNAVNVALMVLAVVILEAGSGLAVAIAQSLKPIAEPVMKDITPVAPSASLAAVASIPPIITPVAVPASPAASQTVQNAAEKIVRLVRDAGGELNVASKRELGRLAGVTHPTANRALACLAGVVAVAASTDGIVLKLAA